MRKWVPANRGFLVLVTALIGALVVGGCGFEQKSTSIAPTTTNAVVAKTFVGTWSSTGSTSLPTPASCTNFVWQITSQTATAISGQFSVVCGSSISISAMVTGQLGGSTVPITLTGTAAVPGVSPSCNISLNGSGTPGVPDANSITIQYSGNTCLGPVSGTEVLKRGGSSSPPPAAPVLNAPVLVSPINNVTVNSVTPVFTFTDATRSGPVGTVTYTIQLARDSGFANLVAVWTIAEQPNQTQLTSPQGLASGTEYYWTVRGSDGTTTSPWSAGQAFQTMAAASAQGYITLNGVNFDHTWTGAVETQLQTLLASGMAGSSGQNGQAVVNQMNAIGGIYAGGEFQPQHDGPGGFPTYGYPWFYVSYVPVNGTSLYQIVEFGTPPPGD